MRFFVIKQDTTLKTLGQKLLKGDRESAPASLDRLRALNPHVDINQLSAGTVLLIPDSADFKADAGDSIGGGFEDFAREVTTALRTGNARVREGLTRRDGQDKEVGKVIKSAVIKNLATDDSELRKRIDETNDRIAAEARDAKQIATRLNVLEEGVAAELEKLQPLAR